MVGVGALLALLHCCGCTVVCCACTVVCCGVVGKVVVKARVVCIVAVALLHCLVVSGDCFWLLFGVSLVCRCRVVVVSLLCRCRCHCRCVAVSLSSLNSLSLHCCRGHCWSSVVGGQLLSSHCCALTHLLVSHTPTHSSQELVVCYCITGGAARRGCAGCDLGWRRRLTCFARSGCKAWALVLSWSTSSPAC